VSSFGFQSFCLALPYKYGVLGKILASKMDEVTGGLEDIAGRRASWSVLLTKCYTGDEIRKNEMGGTCGTYGAAERWKQGVGEETWRKETTRNA